MLPFRNRQRQQQQIRNSRQVRFCLLASGLTVILVVAAGIVGVIVGLTGRSEDTEFEATCSQLPSIPNGAVNINGNSATYVCNSCHRLHGSPYRECSEGVWSGTIPQCTEVLCPALTSPENGQVMHQRRTCGSVAVYSCNTCFELVTNTRTCLQNSAWSGPQPTCTPKCGCSIVAPDLTGPGKRKKRGTEIVGGTEAVPNSWPWMASLQNFGDFQVCGGSLVSDSWVMSAAHCFLSREGVWENSIKTIVLGQHIQTDPEATEVTRTPLAVYTHPNYNPFLLDFDMALIQIEPVPLLPDAVWPVCLPTNVSSFLHGEDAWVTGWGDLADPGPPSNFLQQVKVPLILPELCATPFTIYPVPWVTDNMICAGIPAGGISTCFGDSGGPMVVRRGDQWNLAGIVSWGDVCAAPDSPGVYARVTRLLGWALQTMANN